MKYRTITHNKLSLLEVDNENGLKIIFSPIGASIVRIYLNDKIITFAPEKLDDFFNPENSIGKTIESTSISSFSYNGREYQKDPKYKTSSYCFQSKPYMDKDVFSIMYVFNKKRMVDGLPNEITYYVSYSFSGKENLLLADYRAMCDIPTPVSLTNHLVFLSSSDNIFVNTQESPSFDEEYKIDNKSAFGFKNDKYQVEITSSFDILSFRKEENGVYVEVKDSNPNERILNKKEIYNRQIMYKFKDSTL